MIITLHKDSNYLKNYASINPRKYSTIFNNYRDAYGKVVFARSISKLDPHQI